MTAWIRGSRIVATFLLAFMVWNEIATDSMTGNIDAEAAAEPVQHLLASARGPRPPNPGPDVLVAQPLPAPSPSPTAVPSPSPIPSPTPRGPMIRPLGVFRVTGYSDSPLNGTDGRGITRSGERTRWGVVAVDPDIVPLGSRLRIHGMGNTEFVALDTGGGIVGKWVDVWFSTDNEALRHGVKYLDVDLIEDH